MHCLLHEVRFLNIYIEKVTRNGDLFICGFSYFRLTQMKNRFVLLAQRILLVFALYTFCRLVFYIFNYSFFSNVSASTTLKLFFYGLRFDATAIVISNLLFIALHFYPFSQFYSKSYQFVLKILFLVVNTAAVILNLVDIEFVRFEGKRATTDLFRIMGFGDDALNTIPRMILDYWYLLLLLIVLVYILNRLYMRISIKNVNQKKLSILNSRPANIALALITFGLCFIGFRGGIQLRPINIMTATRYAGGKEVSLLLNTPFTILKTLGKNVLEPVNYFPPGEANKIVPVIHHYKSENSFRRLNIVLIIVESLGREYIGSLNNYPGYTPFLDSLMKHSIVFRNAFANGKRSIEGIPCVIAGIPALMDEPFITSAYNGNKVTSIAIALKKKGYKSLFFHGGSNGTMGFDNFSRLSGYDQYYGRREYNNDADFDGNWGIFDEPFLQYSISKMNDTQQPFHATIFTLSSHHPYIVPKIHEGQFKKGTLPIHQSISYTDYALKKFFETASKTSWYDSTLFIITGDHTAISEYPFYQSHVGMYSVPIIFYQPSDTTAVSNPIITEQIDILPGILNYLHYDEPFFSFGQSMFDSSAAHSSVNYINGVYQLIESEYALTMDTSDVQSVYLYGKDSTLTHNLKDSLPEIQLQMENRLKAIIQHFNNAMLNNTMSAE
jgi:phosphoglycerol transferase MdoB-like AlkP superfamily enzyme